MSEVESKRLESIREDIDHGNTYYWKDNTLWLMGRLRDRDKTIAEKDAALGELSGVYAAQFGAANARLRRENEELRGLLKRLEWQENESWPTKYCPSCESSYPNHAPDCELARAIGGVE